MSLHTGARPVESFPLSRHFAVRIAALGDAAEKQLQWKVYHYMQCQERRSAATVQRLTNRSSQPLAVAMSRLDFMKQFPMFAALAAASDGSAPSR